MTDVLFELLTLDCRIDEYGTVHYYNSSGELHRVHGPAIEWADGKREWCQNGLLHRLDGPAVVCSDGEKFWCQNGQLHRLDGPAVEWPDGTCTWFIDGKALTEAEWQQVVASVEIV